MRPLIIGQGIKVLHEDRELLVIDKPAGLLTIAGDYHRGPNAFDLVNRALSSRGDRSRIAVVHRLDRDTSGVLVFAKSGQTKKTLMNNWQDLVLDRRYTAVVEGDFPQDSGTIDAPLKEDRQGTMRIDPKGQRAITHWQLLEQGPWYSLLELELETGRKNQIRVHLAYLGRPIAGDSKYGAQSDPLKRLALHATSIRLVHPVTHRELSWTVPAPSSFKALVTRA